MIRKRGSIKRKDIQRDKIDEELKLTLVIKIKLY